MCTYARCDYEGHLKVLGQWTCIRQMMWGNPSCVNMEAKFWTVSWVLPKIVGGFDFLGILMNWVNMSNATIDIFETNVSMIFADVLVGVDTTHFTEWKVRHLWESKDKFDADTGLLLSPERTHWFSVNYELLIWDVNTLAANQANLLAILQPTSDVYRTFDKLMFERTNLTLTELFPTIMPITFNSTEIAPDTEISLAALHRVDARLLVLLLAVPYFMPGFLSGRSRGRPG